MAFTAELERVETMQAEKVAQEHNALIKERYRRLQAAEAEQFSTVTENVAAQQTPRASVLMPEAPAPVFNDAPAMEQTPYVTEFVHARVEEPVFTTEKFNGIQQAEAVAVAPTIMATPVAPAMQVNVYAPTQAAVETEAQYTFSAMAKKICLAFAATATIMLSVIGINSGIMRRNNVRLRNLEEQEQSLIERNEELQQRIEAATSEETIIQFAQENGMIKG